LLGGDFSFANRAFHGQRFARTILIRRMMSRHDRKTIQASWFDQLSRIPTDQRGRAG
jgi:hypothetical protein